jgi:hypothetical protein
VKEAHAIKSILCFDSSHYLRQNNAIKCFASRPSHVMVSVLYIGRKVRGFKPDRGDGFIRAIKIRCMASFGREVKLSAPCRKLLRHVKNYFGRTNRNSSHDHIHNFFRPFLLLATRLLCWSDSQKALLDDSGVFFCQYHSATFLHAHRHENGK